MSGDAARELEELVRARAEAVERRDAQALLGQVDADVLDLGVLLPTASRGSGGTLEALQRWFGFYREGPHYEPHLVQGEADGDLGYVAYLYHVTGTTTGGDEMDMWVRSTLVCRRTDDGWRVVHSHESVPMDPGSGQALTTEPPPRL